MTTQYAENSPNMALALSNRDQTRLISWVNDNYTRMKASRSVLELEWYMNMAFYFGKQYVVPRGAGAIATTSGRLWTPPAPRWRARPVINRVRPVIRREIAKVTSSKPTAYIVPATSEDEDLFAAQAGEQIWESIYRRRNVKREIRRMAWFLAITGTGFLKCFWDDDLIDTDTRTPDGTPVTGDINILNVTPFHLMVPDLKEEEIEEQPFLIHARLESTEMLALKYPGINLEKATKGSDEIIDSTWMNLAGSGKPAQDMALCLEAWVKPGTMKIMPEGGVVSVCGDYFLQQPLMDWPYEHREYPFTKIEHMQSGKFYGDSVISDLRPLQKELNRRRGQIVEAANLTAKPQHAYEQGAIDPAKVTSEPGLYIEYRLGQGPPVAMPIPPLPQYIFNELEMMLVDFQDISGQHEVSKGSAPPGVTAATAISFLAEQDETMLSSTHSSLEEGLEKVARQTLSHVHQFWNFERTVKVAGVDGTFDALAFKGSDLRNNTDLRVEGGSSLPVSRAARQAWITDMMKFGFIPVDVGLEAMEMGGVAKIYEMIRVDTRQAQRENIKMAAITQEDINAFTQAQSLEMQLNPEKYLDPQTGEPVGMTNPDGTPAMPLIVPVNDFDNHPVHITTHNNFRKSERYEKLDQSAKEAFSLHVAQHKDQLNIQNMMIATTGIPLDQNMPTDQGGSIPPGPPPVPEGESNPPEGNA